MNSRLTAPYWALRIGLGLGPLLAGIDKFFNILADWQMYLSPYAAKMIPISPALFMRIVGIVEIVAGLIVLAGLTRIGGYIVMIWLIAIACKLVTTGMFYDLAVTDIEISLPAYTLTRLGRNPS